LEDFLFRNLLSSAPILFFYINQPSVIIGRAQNPWLECYLDAMAKDHVLLARRQSGGGAVYHDFGNLNYSILTPVSPVNFFNKADNLSVIIKSLAYFNITAHAGPRHDLWVGDKKISGCAFRQSKDRAFHHGTLLINTDLEKLNLYLHAPDAERIITYGGVRSVRSPVMNLNSLNTRLDMENLIKKIAFSFSDFLGQESEYLNFDQITKNNLFINFIKEKTAELKSNDWLYGKTLPFEFLI